MNFTGNKVLITGGSNGIVLSTSEEFHLLGAEVHISTTTKNKTKHWAPVALKLKNDSN